MFINLNHMLLVLKSQKLWYRLKPCLTGINHNKKGFLVGWNLPFRSITTVTGGQFDRTSLWCSSRYDNVPPPWRRIFIKKGYSISATQDTSCTLWKQNVHYCLQKSLPLVPNLSKMTVLQTTDKSPNFLLTVHIYYPKDKSVMNITLHKIYSGACIM